MLALYTNLTSKIRGSETELTNLQAYCPLVRATKIDDPLLTPLAKKHNKTTSQILLRWGLQKV